MNAGGRGQNERRLAAILAADVAGYSRLIGLDEEGTLGRLKSIRTAIIDPTIAAQRGRLVKTTGDGLLVEFASVVDALRCAVRIQQAVADGNAAIAPEQRIEFRIGINVGDIVVENGDIFGDGVNIAGRLEGLAAPGEICVSERVWEDSAGRLDLIFHDMGEQRLKNIARPIHAYRVTAPGAPGAARIKPADGAVIRLPLPDKPSIAVLPFANMSSDIEQEFFADGIAEDIITALSRYSSLFVIARNSCFTYKGQAVDVTRIGRELGVRYVLEGSLRKSSNRIRVTAQLVEADTGNHVWADRYDRDLADIFAVQDEITDAVTIAIAPAVAEAERHRAMRRSPDDLDTWGAYQRGLWHASKFSAEDNLQAQRCFRDAIASDPNFSGAYCGLAETFWQDSVMLQRRPVAEALHAALDLARQAVARDAADAEAHACLAIGLAYAADYEGALLAARRALAMSPNLASAHRALGMALVYSGKPAEALRAFEIAIRLDPQEPRYTWPMMPLAHYHNRDYDAAVAAARRIISSHPDFPHVYRWLAAALGQLGRTAEAKQALDHVRVAASASLDMYVRHRAPFHRPDDYAHMLEGLRKAGWDE
jgi:adenylate cyclase